MADLKTYKVVALTVGGRGKKIFSAGDQVNENDFAPGVADQLVHQGYLKLSDETIAGPENEFHSEERDVEYTREDEERESDVPNDDAKSDEKTDHQNGHSKKSKKKKK